VNITFFPNAKDMGIAEYAFMAGCLVAVCCGIRLFIRVFQVLEGPKPWPPPATRSVDAQVSTASRGEVIWQVFSAEGTLTGARLTRGFWLRLRVSQKSQSPA